MSASFEFTIRKSSDERKNFGVQFIKKEPEQPDYTLSSGVVTAYDDTGADVTSTVIDDAITAINGDVLVFRVQNGTSGEQYSIHATGTMTNGEIHSAWGLLVVVDPTL